MKLKRIIVAAVLAVTLAPIVGLAQSSDQKPGCQRACFVEYQQRVRNCGLGAAGSECALQAELAYRTCMAVCSG